MNVLKKAVHDYCRRICKRGRHEKKYRHCLKVKYKKPSIILKLARRKQSIHIDVYDDLVVAVHHQYHEHSWHQGNYDLAAPDFFDWLERIIWRCYMK